MIYREQFACLCGFRADTPGTCDTCKTPLFSTADQQARDLNGMPSGKTGRWYPDTDGQGVVYRHGAVHTRPASAIETRRAETVGLRAQPESAVAQRDARTSSPNPLFEGR